MFSFFFVEGGAHGGIVLASNAADVVERPLAFACEVKGVATPVVEGVSSFDEAPLFQLIDENDKPTGQYP